jgi:outer membrane biosynthesis protein TonB
MEEAMSEAFEEGMPESETTSFLPFLLLALLAVGYWLWSRSGTEAAAAAAPLPNAEELRRRRLEALQGKVSTTSTEAAVAAPVQATAEDGLRKRAVAEEAAKARETKETKETKENKETKGTKETETKADKAQPKPEATPTPAKAQSNQGPRQKDLSSTQSAPKPKEEVPKPVPPVPPVPPSTLALRARGTLKGTSHVRNVEVKGESNVEQLLREWDSLKRGLEMPGGPAMGFQRCARMQVCTKMCQASTCSNRLSFVFASRARLSFTPPVTSQNLAPAVMLGEKASQGRRFETGAHHRLCNRFNMIQPDSI